MPAETFVDDEPLSGRADDVDRAALGAELEMWRKRMFRVLVRRQDRYPLLHQLATDAPEPPARWAVRDYTAIRTFLTQALDHAEQIQGGRTSPDALGPAVLRRVFGLTNDTMNAPVKERQEAASALIPGAYTHYEMTEPEVRDPQVEAVIAAILWWRQARHTAATPQPGASGGPKPLFGRDADLTWLGQTRLRLKDTGGLFGIWGLEGIGKTALAERFAWTIGPERVSTIRVGQPGRYAEDLRSVLTRAGHAVPDASPDEYEAALRRHVGNLGALWLLIVDGVTEPDAVDRLGLDRAQIPVLVVADERFSAGYTDHRPDAMPWRHVAPLGRDASLELLTQHFPGASELDSDDWDNLRGLASLTGGHTATLDAISRLLPDLTLDDVNDLLTQVGRTPGQSLASLTRFTGDRELRAVAKPLSWIIRKKLGQLEDDTVALTLLTVVVSCSETGRLLREFIDPVVADLLGRTPWSRELDMACDHLAQMGLATVEGDEVYTGGLVCHLARYELLDDVTRALLAYERVMAVPASPFTLVHYQLNYRRRVYEIASQYGRDAETVLADATNSRFVILDESYYAHYTTTPDGTRTVTLYRLLANGQPLRMDGIRDGWVPVEEEEGLGVLGPMIDGMFDQVMNATLDEASLEAKFGPDRSTWPTTPLEAVDIIDPELAAKVRKIEPELK